MVLALEDGVCEVYSDLSLGIAVLVDGAGRREGHWD